jgi:site-specific DNA recombinase
VLGLVRVSKERDGMVSPEVQRTAITDYCAQRGYEVTGWLEGLDESGSRARSAWWPRLDQAVASVEAGEYDVIVVWKFSRTARHRLRWAVALDRVEQGGGRIESATEQVDVTTSTGRFTRGMLAELNAFEAERIGEVWKEVHARRVNSGRPATGKPKWGYLYDVDAKLHRPDPETGPVLVELYRRYVAGESIYQLVRWLNAHGYRTLNHGLWSDRTLRRVLDSGFAAGLFAARGTLHDGAHVALIERDLWQAYKDARIRRRATPSRRERSQYVLSGLVRCGRCGHAMVAGQFGDARQPKYRCATSKEQGPEACAGGYVMAAYVEREVLAKVEGLAKGVEERRAARLAVRAQQTALRGDVRVLARQLQRAEEALGRLAVQHAETPLPAVVYRASHDQLAAQVAGLQGELEEVERSARRADVNPRAVAAQLLQEWDETPVPQRRQLLSQLVDRVEVLTGRPRARVAVVWAFED